MAAFRNGCRSAKDRFARLTSAIPPARPRPGPVSVAVRAVNRAAIQAGERAVVLGAGPIGYCICLVARERGAEVLVIDLLEHRLALSASMGADTLLWSDAE